jgi:hypothetical protein
VKGIRFRFEHEQFDPPREGISYRLIRGRTRLTVDIPLGCLGGWVRWGWAECSISDPFVKAVGRKVALTRALKDYPRLPRSTRKAIWEAYLKRCPPRRTRP